MISSALCFIFIFSGNIYAIDNISFYRVNLLKSQSSQNHTDLSNKELILIKDGNIETCSFADLDPWMRIDLDRVYNITHIRLIYGKSQYWPAASSTNVLVSNDTENQECTIVRKPSLDITKGYFDFSCEDVVGKIVTLSSNETHVVICELQVFADLKSVNLAYKKPFAQFGAFPSENELLTFDGDTSTCTMMETTSNEFTWLRVILGSVYDISHVNITYLKIHQGMEIFVSNNDANYYEQRCQVTDPPTNTETPQVQSLKCVRPRSGRFVTLKNNNLDSVILCELEIYSKEFSQVIPTESPASCLPHEFKCFEGECIHKDWLCDGIDDCKHADDEVPSSCKSDSSRFRCKRVNESISISSRCDGHFQCSDYSDEENCFDFHDGTLKATYKGESNLFICSDRWISKYSANICKEYDRDYSGTFYTPRNREVQSFLRVAISSKRAYKQRYTTKILAKSTTCDSEKFVGINCSLRTELVQICGKRGKDYFQPYVLKGQDAVPGSWPWHVLVVTGHPYKRMSCGGSLINDRWIISAAHCLNKILYPDEIYIKLGTNTYDDYWWERLYVSHIVKHPKFNQYLENDIVLLRLENRVSYSNDIRPICLPNEILDLKTLKSYQPCVFTGFGYIDTVGTRPQTLQQARMNILDDKKCANYMEKEFGHEDVVKFLKDSNYICGGQIPLMSGKNACFGDAGGALVCKSKNGIWTQIGMSSSVYQPVNHLRDHSCTNSMFLKVDRYLDFIRTTLEKEYASKCQRLFKNHSLLVYLLLILFINEYLLRNEIIN